MKKYDSYKDSGIEWIGKIPSHWEIKRLKNIGKLYSGLSGKSGSDFEKTPTENYKPFINFTNIANNKYVVNDNFGYVKIDEHENQNKVKKNDLFFLMSSENQEDVGKSALLLEDYDELYLNSFCKGFRLNNNLDARFINYLLTSSALSQLISLEGRGFTRINLRMEGVENLPMILPKSTEEQITISNYLDQKTTQIDDLIAKKERLVKLLEEERTAIINQAVTKGLDPTVPMKDSGIEWLGMIPAHWEVKKLKYCIQIQSGKGISSENLNPQGEYAVWGGNGIMGYTDDFSSDGNDLIIGRVGALCGNVHLVEGRKWISDNALFAKTTENQNFMELFLKFLDLNRLANKNAQPLITGTMVKEQFISLPKYDEQEQIATYIDNQHKRIDNLLNKTQQEIELLKEFKTALISEVVTGKVDVREEIIN